jgi:hypothetical protein
VKKIDVKYTHTLILTLGCIVASIIYFGATQVASGRNLHLDLPRISLNGVLLFGLPSFLFCSSGSGSRRSILNYFLGIAVIALTSASIASMAGTGLKAPSYVFLATFLSLNLLHGTVALAGFWLVFIRGKVPNADA